MVYADADQSERVTDASTNLAWSPLGLSADNGGDYFSRDSGGGLLGEQRSGADYYFLFDGLGSVVGVLDSSGALVHTCSYDPWGSVSESGTGAPSPFRFAGGYLENGTTSFDQFGTRYYWGAIGRWTQQDPIAGSIGDPGNADPYIYVGDDPVNLTDPSGLCIPGTCWIKHTVHNVRKWSDAANRWYYRDFRPKVVEGAKLAAAVWRNPVGGCLIAGGLVAGAVATGGADLSVGGGFIAGCGLYLLSRER